MQARSFKMHHRDFAGVLAHALLFRHCSLSCSPQNRTHNYLDFVVGELECKKKKKKKKLKEKDNEVVYYNSAPG